MTDSYLKCALEGHPQKEQENSFSACCVISSIAYIRAARKLKRKVYILSQDNGEDIWLNIYYYEVVTIVLISTVQHDLILVCIEIGFSAEECLANTISMTAA